MTKVKVLIPMKGHSDRIPNKNMREFHEKPLYHQIMNVVLQCSSVEEIIVNTDSLEIKDDIKTHFKEVKIIDRPKEIQGDFVSMNDIINYDLEQTGGEHFLQTHSTNPLLKTETLAKAIDFYFNNLDDYDSVFSVTRLQTRLYWEDGKPVNHDPKELIRTQDLPPIFEENSNFYIFSRRSFREAGNKRIGNKPYLFPGDKLEAIDIDEIRDFRLAEALYNKI